MMSHFRSAYLQRQWAKDGPLQLSLLKALPPLSRAEREARIEALIGSLDAEDGDPDLEPSADAEPSMGWSTVGAQPARVHEMAAGPDLED